MWGDGRSSLVGRELVSKRKEECFSAMRRDSGYVLRRERMERRLVFSVPDVEEGEVGVAARDVDCAFFGLEGN